VTRARRIYRRRDDDQVPTRPVSIEEIMSSAEFALGVADARAGRPYRTSYQAWPTNAQWFYERGRQWAQQAPRTVALKRNGKLTTEAVRWYTSFEGDGEPNEL
jgi:hypothetical protein